MMSPADTMGTPRNERICGWAAGHQPRNRGSWVMSAVRNGDGSVSMASSSPCVRGSGPSCSTSSSLMPTVVNRANSSPSASGTPMAAYWAPTSSRALSASWSSTRSSDEPSVTARMAADSAASTAPVAPGSYGPVSDDCSPTVDTVREPTGPRSGRRRLEIRVPGRRRGLGGRVVEAVGPEGRRIDEPLVAHRLGVELRGPGAELHERPVVVGERRPHEVCLVLPDRAVLLDLLVDLGHERPADVAGGLLVAHGPEHEVEPHDAAVGLDGCGAGVVDGVDDAAEGDQRDARPPGVSVDAALHHAPRRGELLRGAHDGLGEAGGVLLELGHLGRVVHVTEVGRVDRVLGHLLHRGVDRVLGARHGRPVVVAHQLGYLGNVPHRRLLVGVVPRQHHAVALERRERADPGLAVDAFAVGDRGVGALAVVAPAVERADDLAAVDRGAVAEVGTEVGAEGVLDVSDALGVTPSHQVAAEVVERFGLRGEVLGVPDAEPPERDGEGVAMLHGCSSRQDAPRLEHVSIPVEPQGLAKSPDRFGPRVAGSVIVRPLWAQSLRRRQTPAAPLTSPSSSGGTSARRSTCSSSGSTLASTSSRPPRPKPRRAPATPAIASPSSNARSPSRPSVSKNRASPRCRASAPGWNSCSAWPRSRPTSIATSPSARPRSSSPPPTSSPRRWSRRPGRSPPRSRPPPSARRRPRATRPTARPTRCGRRPSARSRPCGPRPSARPASSAPSPTTRSPSTG